MEYQVLYRQLRPKTFSQMIGQETIIQTFKNQIISGHIAHAYLFSGSRGTGKTSAAKILAKAVNCLSPVEGDPCEQCENCVELSRENSLDIIEMDAASNNGVDEIRNLREQVKYPPQTGKYKVYIIDEVHMLSTAAFNALLKTLEEPPTHAIFVLATTEPQKLPATIISRCQRFEFKRIPAGKMVERLQEIVQQLNTKASVCALQLIARSAEGGFRDALSILDMCLGTGREINEELVRQVLGTADTGFLFTFAEGVLKQDTLVALEMIDQLLRDGKEVQSFAKDLSYHFRALLMAKNAGEKVSDLLEITPETALAYIEQGKEATTEKLLYIVELYLHTEGQLRYASSPRIILEAATIKACLAGEVRFASTLEERVDALENILAEQNSKKEISFTKEEDISEKPLPSAEKNHKAINTITNTIENSSSDTTIKPENRMTKAKEAFQETEITDEESKVQPYRSATRTLHEEEAKALMDEKQVWDKVMQFIRKSHAGIYGQLREGKFVGKNQRTYQVLFQKENAFMVNYLNHEARKKTVEEIIEKTSGEEALFEAIIQKDPGEKIKENLQQSTLDQLVKDFGRENIRIDNE
ncbi:MAG: DNA polymerase III subunit gamma/tau [Clostridiales bacterium]|nr:DNA polymerase III subunit gamma/tau [Clostridiales bacterium]